MSPFADPRPAKNGVLIFHKSLVISAMFLLLIPGVTLLFFNHTEESMDVYALKVLDDKLSNEKLSQPERLAILRAAQPVSRLMTSDAAADVAIQGRLDKVSRSYALYRWSKRGAWSSLGVTVVTLFPLLICIRLSRHSRTAYYRSLRIGWQTLRVFAAVQILLQGALAILLAFGVCEWFNVVSLQLVGVAAIGVFVTASLLIRAILSKVPDFITVEGRCLSREEAPELWIRIRQMAARMHTEAPERIIAGIDANFFVTRHPLTMEGQQFHGRTLYVSLPLLKTLTVEEADAIVGHELAHFSGNDTEYSQKIAPLLRRYKHFLGCLSQGPALPLFHFMNIFWCLFLKTLGGYDREREYRADRIGANFTTPAACGRALIKIAAYSQWRHLIEAGVVEGSGQHENRPVREKVETGYPDALLGFVTGGEALAAETPHPFDSHPRLSERLFALGVNPDDALQDELLSQAPRNSWYQEIARAGQMENDLWNHALREYLAGSGAIEPALPVEAQPA